MKTIGLIGGMSWESSSEYYRIINQSVREQLGGTHSAKSVMVSVDFYEIEALQEAGDWEAATEMMVKTAQQVARGGADLVLICTNTMHRMADEVAGAIQIPLLHIADATAAAVQEQGCEVVGLLGTSYTMEQDFYRGRLEKKYGLKVLIPEEAERAIVHQVIFEELVQGVIRPESKASYIEVMQGLIEQGAQGIILGCTEIPLLVKFGDVPVPLFDTTEIHAQAAVAEALRDS
jgi:aspartate racemase